MTLNESVIESVFASVFIDYCNLGKKSIWECNWQKCPVLQIALKSNNKNNNNDPDNSQ